MGKGEGMGFAGFIVLLLLLVGLVVAGLFYFKVWSFNEIRQSIAGNAVAGDKVIISNPPLENDWCRVQVMQNSEIIGWDALAECCVQKYNGFDLCINKNISIYRCFIGDINPIIKWSKVNGYYLNLPADYSKFVNVLNISVEEGVGISTSNCSTLVYPGADDQKINIEKNYKLA